MKILYLSPDFSRYINMNFGGMMKALGEFSDLKIYNHKDDFKMANATDIIEVVQHLYGDGKPDVLMMWDLEAGGFNAARAFTKSMHRIDCLKVLWSVDIHKDAGASHWTFPFIKDARIGLILLSYDKELNTGAGQQWNSLGIPIEFYPFSVDPNMFKPLDVPKKYDVALVGNLSTGYYHLRNAFQKILLEQTNIRYHDPARDGRYYYESFAPHINSAKICVTDSSSYHYPLPKYFEIMACDSLLMADMPMDAEALHFVPNYNFVEVNPQNLMEKIRYYLNHEDERQEIIHNANETILKYHTHQIRARETVDMLKRYA